jgi:hypothetical protein
MSVALTRHQRALLLAASALSLLPASLPFSDVLLAHEESPVSTVLSVRRPERSLPVGEVIRRDPFGGRPLATNVSPEPASGVRVPDIAALPPDFASQAATPNVSTLELKATIVGGRAIAYVQDGPVIDIVHVGSKLGGRSIQSIGLRGIIFNDGTSLELSSHANSVERKTSNQRRPATTIDELRQLLVQALRGRAILPAPSTPSPQVSPSVTPSAPRAPGTFPPPGPLPTIVPDFLPVGVSPTTDPNGATPYPLPPLRPPH